MPSGTIDPSRDYVTDFAVQAQKEWPTITKATAEATAVRAFLAEELKQFTNSDADIVVYGSLGRSEWTAGSDVDWTLLIDGQAVSAYRTTTREVGVTLGQLQFNGLPFKGPGAEGIFGNMAFSHELVHHIGGQSDSNRNTTQRVLLLLEAAPLRSTTNEFGAYERVIRQVLQRYLVSDSNFHSKADQASRIPRFLLNDIVRFWRTMCVDFAYKDWEQAGKKWALRNIKLRTSRKVLFLAGLCTVFSCFRNPDLSRPPDASVDYPDKLQQHLSNFTLSTSLNVVLWSLLASGLASEAAQLLDAYDEYLTLISDLKVREHLEGLSETRVYEDEHFLRLRAVSHRLQQALTTICFDKDSEFREFIREYGVF